MPPFPSLTKTWHDKPYGDIDPTRRELSAKGKVIAITGGGGSIGSATALAFARAGATKIAVIGRREGPLHDTKKKIESQVNGVNVLVVHGDLTQADSMRGALGNVKQELGNIDILVANGGYLPRFESIKDADPEEWRIGFETNVFGAFNLSRAFMPVASHNPIIVDISTCVVHMAAMRNGSGYVASKLAGTKVWETFGVEMGIPVVHIHPGVVSSEINAKSGIAANDDENLPGQFVVWAVSPEAEAFRGKYLWCNWDVQELLSRKEELSKPNQLAITLQGWPFDGVDSSSDALKF